MRIVDVCAFYSPHGGGVKTYVGQKLAMAERFGQDITILAPADEDGVIEVGPCARIRTIRAPRFPLDRKYWYFRDDLALHAVLDQIGPDLVEASSPWRSPLIAGRWRPEIPKALIMHADPLSAYAYRWLEPLVARDTIDRRLTKFWDHLRHLGRLYNVVICANDDLTSRLRAGGVTNAITIPMGVETGRFSPDNRSTDLRARLLEQCELGPDATLLVAAGRLAPEKRVPMLINAATIAGQQRPIGLVIFGEGSERTSILREVRGNPHIRLFRPERDRQRFASILASADALIHGCEAETFCMTAAEARASGIPVIVPDRGGASDFAKDGKGIAYRAANRIDLVRAILELPDRFTAAASRETVRSMDDHFSALFSLYQNLHRSSLAQPA